MLTTITKHVAIVILTVTAILWADAPHYALAFRFAIAMSGAMVAVQALRYRKRGWAAGFFTIAALYNPILPLASLTGRVALGVVVATIVPFSLSIYRLRAKPLLSIPSITDRNPGSESL